MSVKWHHLLQEWNDVSRAGKKPVAFYLDQASLESVATDVREHGVAIPTSSGDSESDQNDDDSFPVAVPGEYQYSVGPVPVYASSEAGWKLEVEA